jgi:hypothetical protein
MILTQLIELAQTNPSILLRTLGTGGEEECGKPVSALAAKVIAVVVAL